MKKHIIGGLTLTAVFVGSFIALAVHDRIQQEATCALMHFYVDFDTSMQLKRYPQRLHDEVESHFYEVFKTLYEKNSPQHMACHEYRIPKIIHQIWLGSPFPEKYRAFQETWQKHHPDWEYRLWTDEDLEQFELVNRELYDAALNYGEKSDIARYEILYKFGGLYVDTDFECVQPLDLFHRCYDFYIGIQPLDTNFVQLGIGLIGSVPGHPVLKCCIDNMAKNAAYYPQIIQKTGPIYFTRVFELVAPLLQDRTVALPATYFYPKGYTQKDADETLWRRPESFAVHHWEGSWLKKEAFVHKGERDEV